MPPLGRWKEEHPWGFLASQSSVIAVFQAKEKPFLKRGVCPGLCMHVFTCVHMEIFFLMFDKDYN